MPQEPDHTVVDEVVGDMRRIQWEFHFIEGHVPKMGKKVYYILVGPKGAVQFAYMWHEGLPEKDRIMGMDVGYHSYEPMYENQGATDCDLMMGQDYCYYDGSGLRADGWVKMWLEADRNDEVIWTALKSEYEAIFEEGVEQQAVTTETTQEEDDG